jgi:hypothetical protein
MDQTVRYSDELRDKIFNKSFTDEDIEKIKAIKQDKDALDKFSEKMITGGLITPDNIYIDLQYFKDLKLGSLMSLLYKESKINDVSEKFNKIKLNMQKYTERKTDDLSKYFDIGYTNDDIDNHLNDPQYSDEIFMLSPATAFIHVLSCQTQVNVNHSAVIGKRDVITFTVNTYPLNLGNTPKRLLGDFINSVYYCNCNVIYKSPSDIAKTIKDYDELYLFNLDKLSQIDLFQKQFSELTFLGKRIFAPALFKDEHSYKIEESQVNGWLNLGCDFTYVRSEQFSPGVEKDNKK